MTMLQAVGKCLRKYAKFSGRASRSEYWWFILFAFLFEWPYFLTILPGSITIPFTQIEITLFSETDVVNRVLQYLYFTMSLLLIIPQLAVFTRRLHDTGKRGWSWLLIFIPIIGWIILTRRLAKKGDDGPNKFGDPDNEARASKDVRTKVDAAELMEPSESEGNSDATEDSLVHENQQANQAV